MISTWSSTGSSRNLEVKITSLDLSWFSFNTIVVIVAVTSSSCSSIYCTDFNTQISNFSSSPSGEGNTIQRTGAAQLSERASKASTSGEEHCHLCSYEQWKNLCCTWNRQRSPGKEK